MKNFGYCIWLTSSKSTKLDDYTNGFKTHLSIKTNLSYNDALLCYNSIKKPDIVYLQLAPKIEKNTDDNFYCACYPVSITDIVGKSYNNKINVPIWMPTNPHISFYYDYEKEISNDTLQKIDNNIGDYKDIIFDCIKIVKCDGHFTQWKEIATK